MVSVSGFRSWRPKEMGRHDSTRSILYDPRCFGARACHDRSGSSSTTTSLPVGIDARAPGVRYTMEPCLLCRFIMIYKRAS